MTGRPNAPGRPSAPKEKMNLVLSDDALGRLGRWGVRCVPPNLRQETVDLGYR